MIGPEIEQLIRRIIREECRVAVAEVIAERGSAQLVSPATYAAAHSIAESTVHAAIADGRLPSTKIGRARRIPADAAIAQRSKPTEIDQRAARTLGLVRGGR